MLIPLRQLKPMSSHHVVREKQEPALLVLGIDDFSDEMLGQLLEWSPTVIATNDTAEKLDASGIKIDYIIGNETGGFLQSDVQQLRHGKSTIVQSVLKFLADNGYPSVNIITNDFNPDDFKPFADLINLVIFHGHKKIYPVAPGFGKWLPAGVCIEILSEAPGVQITGLQPVADRRYLTTGDGFFTLFFNGDLIFIAEEI